MAMLLSKNANSKVIAISGIWQELFPTCVTVELKVSNRIATLSSTAQAHKVLSFTFY